MLQLHLGVHSQRHAGHGRRYRRYSGAGGNTLSLITQTHQTKKTRHALNATRHALNARHCISACNAGNMQANPCLTPPFPCTAYTASVWMARTCERCLVLPRRMQTRSGQVLIIRPPAIALHPTPPVEAPAGHPLTSTTHI